MQRNQLKYFERYTDFASISRWKGALEKENYSHLCVVPARCERSTLPHLLESFTTAATQFRPLLILVLNSTSEASEWERAEQSDTWTFLTTTLTISCELADATLLTSGSFDVFVIDRFSSAHSLPPGKGVGTARKIGCDLAAWLRTNQISRSNLLLSTDADAILPSDYFSALSTVSTDTALAYYSFSHRLEGNREQQNAMRMYELWMRHYTEGLERARSPFAVPALGSIYAINSSAYIQARGFSERLAGEDFYLMNKLLKLGRAQQIHTQSPLQLSGRVSHRTPFGTGPSVGKWLLSQNIFEEKLFYNPQCFDVLGSFLSGDLTTHADLLPPSAVTLSENRNSPMSFHEQFDALRTLQFIHYLRDHHLPNLSHRELQQRLQAA